MSKNKSSTEHLDNLVLDDRSLVVRDSLDSIKGYCGLFAFVLSICNNTNLDDIEKVQLIHNIVDASISFMERKYEVNLEIYNRNVMDNLEEGKLFESLSELPAKIREDFEIGLQDTREYLFMEIRDILTILKINLEL